jgi:hypothetical protein
VSTRPYISSAFPGDPPSTVEIVAVPLQVAVPLPSVAVVGAADAPPPLAVIVRAVPDAIVFVPVSATVAVAVDESLKLARVHVCPAVPVIVPPLVYVPEATPVDLYFICSDNTCEIPVLIASGGRPVPVNPSVSVNAVTPPKVNGGTVGNASDEYPDRNTMSSG